MPDSRPTSVPQPASEATAGAASAGELRYVVAGMSCNHCKVAVSNEVSALAGVGSVHVDLDSKLVRVRGSGLDDAAVRAAIDEAGYDAVPA